MNMMSNSDLKEEHSCIKNVVFKWGILNETKLEKIKIKRYPRDLNKPVADVRGDGRRPRERHSHIQLARSGARDGGLQGPLVLDLRHDLARRRARRVGRRRQQARLVVRQRSRSLLPTTILMQHSQP